MTLNTQPWKPFKIHVKPHKINPEKFYRTCALLDIYLLNMIQGR